MDHGEIDGSGIKVFLHLSSLHTVNPLPQPKKVTPAPSPELQRPRAIEVHTHGGETDDCVLEEVCAHQNDVSALSTQDEISSLAIVANQPTQAAREENKKVDATGRRTPRKSATARRTVTPAPVTCSCRPRSRTSPSPEAFPSLPSKSGEPRLLPGDAEGGKQALTRTGLSLKANISSILSTQPANSPKVHRPQANEIVLRAGPSPNRLSKGMPVQHLQRRSPVPKPSVQRKTLPSDGSTEVHENGGDRSPKLAVSGPKQPAWKRDPHKRLVGRDQYASLYRASAPRADEHSHAARRLRTDFSSGQVSQCD